MTIEHAASSPGAHDKWLHALQCCEKAAQLSSQIDPDRAVTDPVTVGKALRAVDDRLLVEWTAWIRAAATATATATAGEHTAKAASAASAAASCRELWSAFRPRTNADLQFKGAEPAHGELIFLSEESNGSSVDKQASAEQRAAAACVQVPAAHVLIDSTSGTISDAVSDAGTDERGAAVLVPAAVRPG
jgi:hypothetical protein